MSREIILEKAENFEILTYQISQLNEYINRLDAKADVKKVKAAFKIAELLLIGKPMCKKENINYKEWVVSEIKMSYSYSQQYVRAYEKFGGEQGVDVHEFGLSRLIAMSPSRLKDIPSARFLLEEIKKMTVKEVGNWVKETFPPEIKPKTKIKEVQKIEKAWQKKIEKLNGELEDGEITESDIDVISDNIRKSLFESKNIEPIEKIDDANFDLEENDDFEAF